MEVLHLMYTCKTCGYKYNITMSYTDSECIICQSVPISLRPTKPEPVSLVIPY
jgi:DNA-directed RNA polymerase subunit RPC12/RpoP